MRWVRYREFDSYNNSMDLKYDKKRAIEQTTQSRAEQSREIER